MRARTASTARTRRRGAGLGSESADDLGDVYPDSDAPSGTVRPVELGAGIVVGGPRVPVVAPARRGAEIAHGAVRQAEGEAVDLGLLARLRADTAGALLVQVENTSEIDLVVGSADAVVLDVTPDAVSWRARETADADADLESDAESLPLPLLLRGAMPVSDWQQVVVAARRMAGDRVVVVQRAGHGDALDLAAIAEIRSRTGVPVIVDLTGAQRLAAPAVAAGADGLWLGPEVSGQGVAAVIEVATTLAPSVRSGSPPDLAGLRAAIDGVDAALAMLLERRVELAGRVQQLKPVGGHAGRNPDREAAIVRAMATRAPSLEKDQLARIMDAVITAGLDVAERDRPAEPPVWRL